MSRSLGWWNKYDDHEKVIVGYCIFCMAMIASPFFGLGIAWIIRRFL